MSLTRLSPRAILTLLAIAPLAANAVACGGSVEDEHPFGEGATTAAGSSSSTPGTTLDRAPRSQSSSSATLATTNPTLCGGCDLPESTSATSEGCAPVTCAVARSCGFIDDGCGGTVDCGSCESSPGESATVGSGTVESATAESATVQSVTVGTASATTTCPPLSCDDYPCGYLGNECGASLYCGPCEGGVP